MIIKALHFLTGGVPIWHTHFPSSYYIPPQDGFLYTHFCMSEQLESNYLNLPKLKKIINIRDLRDVCVSIVRQIHKAPWPGMSWEQRKAFLEMSFDEQLLFVINFDYELEDVSEFAPNSLQTSMIKVAEQSVKYSLDDGSLVCRYESLVGPKGGGSEEMQREELRRIAAYIGVDMTESFLDQISTYIYGNEVDPFKQKNFAHFRSTFHQGKTQNWKVCFKEDHKEAFKNKLGKYLIALGYEQDNNW
ncbi:MAG: sulfotransferase domain-containing protein [Verrucomicrobia bacterium]|nr:sulfotransferase domain-containing protein [Verrucomicrobiota bacterium]